MSFKDLLLESMTNVVAEEAGFVTPELDDNSEPDTNTIIKAQNAVLSFGGDFDYEDGVMTAQFEHWDSVEQCCALLDDIPGVESYELMAFHRDVDKTERVEIDIDDIVDEGRYYFIVIIYFAIDTVIWANNDEYEEIEDDEDELNEVRRRIKVDSKGKRRIKMQCRPGFKWNGSACVKITGAELATSRKAKRRAVLTKKSQGSALKIRVARKSRKARRFRKAMGLS